MKRNCKICGVEFKKPINCSLKEWSVKRKCCSRKCADKSKFGRVPWNKGLTEQNSEKMRIVAEHCREAFRSGRAHAWSKGIKGEAHPLYGRPLTDEHRGKISKAHTGANHWNWKGGITDAVHRLRNKMQYQSWRERVLATYGKKCQNCGTDKMLHCHHIKSFRHFPELRYDVTNAIVLCASCHQKEHVQDSY